MAPEEVLVDLLAGLAPLPPRRLPLATCAGLVVAAPVRAPFPLPRFTNAAMDGFALRHADGAGPRRIVGRALAGEPWPGRLGPGEAVAIATGAMLPEGADTVLPTEWAAVHGDTVEPDLGSVRLGANVRTEGEVAASGDVLVPAGHTLGPGQLAICAATGVETVEVHPRPAIAVLPTGTEVHAHGEAVGPAGIHDAVTIPLVALLEELGALARPQPPVADDRRAIMAALRGAAEQADLVFTVGGVSVGPRDLVKDLNSVGVMRSVRVAMRPGKPFAYGTMFLTPVIGLPGNPDAALAAFEVFGRPAVRALLGRDPRARRPVQAMLTEPLRLAPGRLHMVSIQVRREGNRLLARRAGAPGAGGLSSLAAANAWARIAAGSEEVVLPAGAEIEVDLFADPLP